MDVNLNSKLNTLSELSRLKLANILTSIGGQKDLIIETNLIRSLDKICGTKWLKLYDVEKIYKLEDNLSIKSASKHVFLISSNLIQFKRVINILESSNIIELDTDPSRVVKYHIIVIPKKLITFDILLEESGLCGLVQIHAYMWQFMYLDQGLISLELPSLFPEIFVEKDWSLLTTIGKSLYFLFDVVGKPKISISIGQYAQHVFNHIEIFEKNLGESEKIDSDFGAILIMDRSVDYVGALLTNVTYTGLLGEIFKINGGVVEQRFQKNESPKDEASSNEPKSNTLFIIDIKNDSVYSKIKYNHISEVSDILGNDARQVKTESQSAQGMALSEIKTYVKTKLQDVTAKTRYLSYHLHACEKIISELGIKFENLQFTERSFLENINKSSNITNIEDYIITENQLRSLRLFCLISLTQKLSWDEYNNLKLQYLHEHGYNLLYIFQNLINCGLLLQPQSKLSTLSLPSLVQKKDFYSIANKLKLIPQKPEEVDVRSPKCPSYVFGGNYIPIVAQLLSFLFQAQNINDITSKLDLLSGTLKIDNIDKPFPLQQRTILVFIIGGLTYAEIAACSLVEKLFSCKIILASNCLITGNDLVNQCI